MHLYYLYVGVGNVSKSYYVAYDSLPTTINLHDIYETVFNTSPKKMPKLLFNKSSYSTPDQKLNRLVDQTAAV